MTFLTLAPVNSLQAQGPPDRESADLILHNGVIWTVDSKNSIAQAVAIRDSKFIVVGSNEAALKLRGPKTQMIDLQGNFVTPGFNDNHVHFASAAQFLEFNIMAVSTQRDFVARVREVISRLPKGEWIVGGFWGTAYANFEEKIKGSIEVGKLADLAVLSKNLPRVAPRELLKAEVVYTIVNGKVVYPYNLSVVTTVSGAAPNRSNTSNTSNAYFTLPKGADTCTP